MNVLLVDDNRMEQEISRKILEKLDCQVQVAESGEESVALAKETMFDLILMDINMPGGLSGAEATQVIRRQGVGSPWVIALSIISPQELREAGLDTVFDRFILKPLTTSGFLKVAQSRIEQH